MTPHTTAPRLAAAALAFLVLPIAAAHAADEDGFVRMFNGKDLGGWRTTGNWVVEEGNVVALQPRPGESGWTRYNDYLATEREYGDFILDLEFKINRGGNSGVFLRVGDLQDHVESGFEVQILDTHGKENPDHHDCGGIVRIQLNRIKKRIEDNYDATFEYSDDVVAYIVARCNDPDSGGRMIDNILTNTLLPELSTSGRFEEDEFADAFARIENHFFVNAGWMDEGQLLREAHKLTGIPGVIVHGRYDMPCPAKYAWQLHKAWPDAEFYLVEGSGHAQSEAGHPQPLV